MKKVLFIEWSSTGRDFEIVLPLMYFFETYLRCDIKYISIFNLPAIINEKPDLVIMSNTGGATTNSNISELVTKSGFLLFSHVSEGLFRESNIKDMVYGHNKTLNETLTTYWSYQSYKMALRFFPNINSKAFVSGSLSHDKYNIFFKKDNIDTLHYKKVISYMSFDFHTILNNKQRFENRLGKSIVDSQIRHIKLINKILLEIVKNNEDILFIFKSHPGDGEKKPVELKGLSTFKNTKLLKECSVVDVINISDIVLNFQSSTNIEAWLMKKISIRIFDDERFKEIYSFSNGAPNLQSVEELQSIINEFYNTGKVEAFEEKKELREKIISDYIGFADGFNHIRFMSFLKPYIEQIENGEIEKGKWNIPFKTKLKGYIRHFLYSTSKGKYNTPILKRWARRYDIFNDKQVEEQKKLRYPDFDKFYKKNQLQIDYIYQNWHKNWKSELGIKE